MSNVVPFGKKPEPLEQWAAGETFCIACDHRWAATAPTGTVDLECPNCHTMKGKFRFEFKPSEGQLVRECRCSNQLFYITPDGHMCANCGIYQRY
jgi:hypothetical protein